MAFPARIKTWSSGEVLTANDLNTEFNIAINALSAGDKDANVSALTAATLAVSGAATLSSTLAVTGATTLSGAVQLGDAQSDAINIVGNVTADIISFAGLFSPGWVNNLGLSLSSGTLTVTDASNATLSATNRGYVCVPSTTAGRHVVLKVIAPATINDDSHASASDLTNLGFGITEAADWAQDMPYWIYVANRGNNPIDATDGNSVFFLSRNPCLSTTPSSADDIHDTGGLSANDTQDVIIILGDVTVANYVSLPCQLIGCVRMRWSTATDDWTIQTLGNSDGFGLHQLRKTFAKTWTYVVGQNGASASRFSTANGGTAPSWSTQTYFYKVHENGEISISVDLNGDGGTDGSGAVDFQLTLPYQANTDHATPISCGSTRSTGSGLTEELYDVRIEDSTTYIIFIDRVGGAIENGDFSNGNRSLGVYMTYPAFVV